MKRIIAIIPARYDSSRFQGKPLAIIDGKPMIRRVYENAGLSSNVSDVVVATDDLRIFDTVRGFDGKVVMTSAQNHSGTDRAGEAAEILKLNDDDIIINIQGDQPVFNPLCIDELASPFFRESEPDMSTLGFKIINKNERTNPKDVKVTFDINQDALYFSRSPIPFARDTDLSGFDMYKHLGFYAYSKRFLEIFRKLPKGRLENTEKLEQLRAIEHGYKIRVVITEFDSPEVDLPEDIDIIEKIIKIGKTDN